MSENRTSRLANQTKKCPDFKHPVIGRPKTIQLLRFSAPICLKSGRYVRFSDTLDFHNVWKPDAMSGFQTHWTFIMSENRSNWMVFGRPITGCLKSGHFFVRFAKPDFRFSDIHCTLNVQKWDVRNRKSGKIQTKMFPIPSPKVE